MKEKIKKLKPYQEIYLLVFWISVQIILGTYIKRNLISQEWMAQFIAITLLFAGGQLLSLVNYFSKKYE